MKKFFLLPILFVLVNVTTLIVVRGQVAPCPSISATSATLSCTTPCATITAAPSASIAATNTYSVSPITFSPFPYTGTNWTTTGGAGWSASTDDAYGKIINLPFNFCFFGNSFSSIVIGTNGNISFNAAANAGGYDPWPISGPLLGSITGTTSLYNNVMGCWQDTYVGGGPITYASYGTAPCREFVISWNAVDLFLPGSYCPGTTMTSQIVLYESSNIVDIYIAHRAPCAAPVWNNAYAVCAIVNGAGSTFYTPPPPTPSENGTTFTANNLAWRFMPTGATGGWTYNWTGPGGASLGTTASITVCPTVTTTYTVTATSTACSGFSMSATSTVTTTTFLGTITGNTTICAGTTTTLSDATAAGTWSSSNTSVATIGLTSGVVTGISGGTTTITYSQGGCASYTTVTVIDPGPITGPLSVCPGGSVALTDNPAGGTWSSMNTGVAVVGLNSGIVTGVAAGITNITYTVGPGCTAVMPLSVVVLSPISGITTVCQGSNVTLSDSAPGGTWSSNNTGVATIGLNTGVVGGVAQGNAIITYTTGGGCYTTTTVTVNPDLPITGPTSECQRWTSITLSDPVGGGTWTSGNVSIATVTPTTGTVYGVTPGLGGNVTITYVNMYGCVETYPITINPTPVKPAVSPITVCQFWQMGANSLSPSGAAYLWYGPGVTAGSTTPPVPQDSVAGTDSFYVTYTSPFGCVSDSSLMMVYVTAKPDTPTTFAAQYCQFYQKPAAVDSQVSNYTGTLKWYIGGVLQGTAPVPQDSAFTYPGYEVFYVTQTVNGCPSDSAIVPVRIIPLPRFTISHPDWVCQFDSISLSYFGDGGSALVDSVYMWTVPPGAFFANGTTATDSMVTVQFDSATTDNYVTLTVGNLGGECSTTETIRQNVIALPSATATSKADVCPSDTVTIALSTASPSAIDFTWYVDNSPLASSNALSILSANSNSGGPYTIQWNDTGMHIIHVQAFAVHGCTDKPSADTVEVHPLPDATFTVSPLHSGTLCLQDSVLFKANDDNYADNYYWTPEHYFNNDDKHTIWGRVQEEQSIVTLKVTNPFGCVATWSMELDPSVCCNVPFPSAFTPNGDGLNDLFRPVEQLHEYHTYHVFRVQNRWGQTIFETTNNKAEWDGTFNGVPCDLGVYYYYLKYDCNGKTLEEKGDVTLIR